MFSPPSLHLKRDLLLFYILLERKAPKEGGLGLASCASSASSNQLLEAYPRQNSLVSSQCHTMTWNVDGWHLSYWPSSLLIPSQASRIWMGMGIHACDSSSVEQFLVRCRCFVKRISSNSLLLKIAVAYFMLVCSKFLARESSESCNKLVNRY